MMACEGRWTTSAAEQTLAVVVRSAGIAAGQYPPFGPRVGTGDGGNGENSTPLPTQRVETTGWIAGAFA